MPSERPLTRNRSQTIQVAGEFSGRPVIYEVHTEEWLNRKTGRYRLTWAARQKGALGWHTGRTARIALTSAAYLSKDQRPKWLPTVVAKVEGKLR